MARTKTTTEAPAEVTETPAETFSPKDLAAELGIDAKSFRRWLRAQTEQRANKGGRWVFNAEARAAYIELYNKRSTKGTAPAIPAED